MQDFVNFVIFFRNCVLCRVLNGAARRAVRRAVKNHWSAEPRRAVSRLRRRTQSFEITFFNAKVVHLSLLTTTATQPMAAEPPQQPQNEDNNDNVDNDNVDNASQHLRDKKFKPTELLDKIKKGEFVLVHKKYFVKQTTKPLSSVWDQFKVICNKDKDQFGKYDRTNYVICTKTTSCKKIFKFTTSTGNFNKHLDKHGQQKQSTISATTNKKGKKFKIEQQHKRLLMEKSMDAIAVDLNKFNCLDKNGMRELLRSMWNLGAHYKINLNEAEFKALMPSPNSIGANMITEADKITAAISSTLKKIITTSFPPPISLATDMWTNTVQNIEVFGLIVFYIQGRETETTDAYIGFGDFEVYHREAVAAGESRENDADADELQLDPEEDAEEDVAEEGGIVHGMSLYDGK